LTHILNQFARFGIAVDGPSQSGLESNQMSAAFSGVYIVHKGENRFGITRVVLESHLDDYTILLAFKVDGPGTQSGFILVEVLDELLDPPFVLEFIGLIGPFIDEGDFQSFVQERQLSQPLA
jgi:hypothetical protein